jgi:hypothetical protein
VEAFLFRGFDSNALVDLEEGASWLESQGRERIAIFGRRLFRGWTFPSATRRWSDTQSDNDLPHEIPLRLTRPGHFPSICIFFWR